MSEKPKTTLRRWVLGAVGSLLLLNGLVQAAIGARELARRWWGAETAASARVVAAVLPSPPMPHVPAAPAPAVGGNEPTTDRAAIPSFHRPPSTASEAGGRGRLASAAGRRIHGQIIAGPAASPQAEARATALALAPDEGEEALIGEAIRRLRLVKDPRSALDLLAAHARSYPLGEMARERSLLRAEALLAQGDAKAALEELDGLILETLPGGAERLVVRGELRARARRWADALDDFRRALPEAGDRAAAGVLSSPLVERALWGRAVAHAQLGDRSAAARDLTLYLSRFPHGRFAPQADHLKDALR